MKAILWKEYREHYLTAVVFCLGLAAIDAWTVHVIRNTSTTGLVALALSSLLAAVALAAVLGGRMIGNEKSSDLVPFLLHRPVSRSRIWASKSVAGLTLTVLALALPIGAGMWWTSIPGHLPEPFEWRRALSMLRTLAEAPAFFFAGMLVAQRPARWYGSKAAPIALAIGAVGLADWLNDAWQAIGVLLAAASVFAAAAWGSFLTQGEYDRQPLLGRAALCTALYTGLLAILFAVSILVNSLYTSQRRETQEWTLAVNGDPAIDRMDQGGGETTPSSLYDVVRRTTIDSDAPVQALPGPPVPPNDGEVIAPIIGDITRSDSVDDNGRMCYFDAVTRRISAYDVKTNQRVALSPAFPSGAVLLSPYMTYMTGRNAIVAGDRFYQLSLSTNAVTSVIASASGEKILAINVIPLGDGSNFRCLIATRTQFEVLDRKGRLLAWIPRRGDSDASRILLLQNGDVATLGAGPGPELSVYTRNGRLISRRRLPMLPMQAYPAAYALSLGCPPAGLLIPSVWRLLRTDAGYDPRALRIAAAIMALACILSAVLAWLCGARYGFTPGERLPWSAACAALGPLALLTLLSLREFPARAACPECGRRRIVNRERCEHCGAPWPRRAASPTDIFDVGAPASLHAAG